MNVARLGNKYLADEEPWKTIKTDTERTQTVMYIAAQIAAALAILSEPFCHILQKAEGTVAIRYVKNGALLEFHSEEF